MDLDCFTAKAGKEDNEALPPNAEGKLISI